MNEEAPTRIEQKANDREKEKCGTSFLPTVCERQVSGKEKHNKVISYVEHC